MSLLTIPGDIHYLIRTQLSLNDIRALGRTCHQLNQSLFRENNGSAQQYWKHWYRTNLSDKKCLMPELSRENILRKGYEKCLHHLKYQDIDVYPHTHMDLRQGHMTVAIIYQHWDIVSYFLRPHDPYKGCKIRPNDAETAARYGQKWLLDLYLSYSTELPMNIIPILDQAIFGGQIEIVRFLLDLIPQSELHDQYHMYNAIKGKHYEIMELLIQHGFDKPNDVIVKAVAQEDLKIVKIIVEANVTEFYDAMCEALRREQFEILEYLLSQRKTKQK
jgi:hypothetical protein